MNSILPFLGDIKSTRRDGSDCGIFDVDAKLALKVNGHLLVAVGDDGAIYSPPEPYPKGPPEGPVVIPLQSPVYRLAPSTMQCSPFTNLQRLLVMLPEATP